MSKNQIIKMEFTSGSSNSFDIQLNNETNIKCGGKAAGKINDDFFSAEYKFNVDVETPKISDIHFTNITHIGKTIIPENTKKNEKSDNTSSYSDIIDDTFEQSVYNILFFILNNGIVNKIEKKLTIEFINNNTVPVDFLVLHIKIGTHECNSSSSVHNENINNLNAVSQLQNNENINLNNEQNTSSKSAKIIIKSSKLSKSNESGKSDESDKNTRDKKSTKNILKLLSWSIVISFVMHTLKSKVKKERVKVKS